MMRFSSIRYLIKEGFKNTWANRLMSLASIGVLVACMVIIGLAILISENVSKAIGNLEQQNVVMVYMKDYNWALYGDDTDDTSSTASTSSGDTDSEETESSDKDSNSSDKESDKTASEDSAEKADENGIRPSDYVIHSEKEAQALCDKIKELDNVADAKLITSEEALKRETEDEKEGEDILSILDGDNPMPNAAEVKMKDMELFDETIAEIEKLDGVANIRSYEGLAGTITAIKNGIGVAGVWIIAILMIIALVIVSNTIRVTMYNRKLEISIMKAVGATDTFIRIPFVVEGMLIGIISAIIAEGLLYFCYRVATETIISTLNTNDIVKYIDMAIPLLLVFLSIGLLAGIIGSIIIISKYLRREGSEFTAI